MNGPRLAGQRLMPVVDGKIMETESWPTFRCHLLVRKFLCEFKSCQQFIFQSGNNHRLIALSQSNIVVCSAMKAFRSDGIGVHACSGGAERGHIVNMECFFIFGQI